MFTLEHPTEIHPKMLLLFSLKRVVPFFSILFAVLTEHCNNKSMMIIDLHRSDKNEPCTHKKMKKVQILTQFSTISGTKTHYVIPVVPCQSHYSPQNFHRVVCFI